MSLATKATKMLIEELATLESELVWMTNSGMTSTAQMHERKIARVKAELTRRKAL